MKFSNLILVLVLLEFSFKGRFAWFFDFMLKTSRTEVFCKKGALNHLVKFTEQSLLRGYFSIKVVSLQSATLLKRRLQHRCFPVNVVKYLRTPILIKKRRRTVVLLILLLGVTRIVCGSSNQECSVRKVFINTSHNSQEIKCASLFFNKVASLSPATLLKKRLWDRCFAVNFAKFSRTLFFHRTPLLAASVFDNFFNPFVPNAPPL